MPGHIGGGFGFSGPMDYSYYECLPPVEAVNINGNLNTGTFENAIPWRILLSRKVNPDSRLIFEQRIGEELLSGKFVSLKGDKSFKEVGVTVLTTTPSALQLLKGPSRRRSMEFTPFIRNLMLLNEEYHLFQVEKSVYLENQAFGSLVAPGTVVFSNQFGAIVLSGNRRHLSVCVRMGEYRDTAARTAWLNLRKTEFEQEDLSKIVFDFVQSAKVIAVLRCEELLLRK